MTPPTRSGWVVIQQPGYWFEHFGQFNTAHGLGESPSSDGRAPLWSHFTRWMKGEVEGRYFGGPR